MTAESTCLFFFFTKSGTHYHYSMYTPNTITVQKRLSYSISSIISLLFLLHLPHLSQPTFLNENEAVVIILRIPQASRGHIRPLALDLSNHRLDHQLVPPGIFSSVPPFPSVPPSLFLLMQRGLTFNFVLDERAQFSSRSWRPSRPKKRRL